MEEKIDIVACTDKLYIMPTGVMMYSVCANNPDVDIDFHIIIDESVTVGEQQSLTDSISKFEGKRVLFYPFKNVSDIDFPIIRETHLPRAAYFRLFLSSILPTVIDKVLYLDGDLIVRHSLLPLWHTDLDNYAVGAVIDVNERDIKLYNRLRYSYEKGYFNSGVLLINLRYWRKNHIEEDFVEYIVKTPERILYADQDIMNVVFQDNKLTIPIKYNLQTQFLKKDPCWDYWKYEEEFKEGLKDPVIVHFTSKWKPWYIDLQISHPYRSSFLKYQRETKWANLYFDRRSLYMKIRDAIGDILKHKGNSPKSSKFLNLSPID